MSIGKASGSCYGLVVAAAVSDISRHGRDVGSVFDLLGIRENDLTAALGFTLSRSPTLLAALVEHVLPGSLFTSPGELNDVPCVWGVSLQC
ncbi:MAG: hypothetical protein ACR2FF_08495 [Mycobacteriales bacterium]